MLVCSLSRILSLQSGSAVIVALTLGGMLNPAQSRADSQEDAGPTCAGNEYGAEDRGALAQFDRELRIALKEGDAELAGLLASYPLTVNESGGSTIRIANPQALKQHYDAIFPQAITDAVLNTSPGKVSCMSAGVMYANGALWARPTVSNGHLSFRIDTMNNMGTETAERSTSTEPRLVFVCETEHVRSAVFRSAERGYRLKVWTRPRSIVDAPDVAIPAGDDAEQVEGSGVCAHRIWSFERESVRYSLAELGCGGDSEPARSTGNMTLESGPVTRHDQCQ